MSLRILVAEDHEENRKVICRRLERLGHTCMEAEDGAAAVVKVRDWAPDIILMDLSMPNMDGIEAWRMICEMVETPPPVIALTATVIQDVRLNCADLGFSAFLTKPVSFAELIETIGKFAPTKAAA